MMAVMVHPVTLVVEMVVVAGVEPMVAQPVMVALEVLQGVAVAVVVQMMVLEMVAQAV